MEYGVDFTIEPLKKRSHGHKQAFKPSRVNVIDMETPKQFKNPPALREYWRIHKQEQRAQKNKKKEKDAKT